MFETALGFFGIAWNDHGVTRLCLPQRDRNSVERRLAGHAGTSPSDATSGELPKWIVALIGAIQDYARGEEVDFSSIPVDLSGIDGFRLAIYDQARQLKFGETATYGGLAERAAQPGMARETGQALGSNPVPLIIPCHRILAAGGKIGGFSAPGGSATKERMLALEGVFLGPPKPAQESFGF